MKKPYNIIEGVFYITNVCNLTCDTCMTYNNRIFKGHFLWNDYKDHYHRWSELLSMDRISILGGEPFANPDLVNWAAEIRKLWPECSNVNVCTNGTYLKNNIDLSRQLIKQNIWLDVCVHDPVLYDDIKNNLEDILSIFKFTKVSEHNHDIGFHYIQVDEYYQDGVLLAKLSKQWNFSSNSTTKTVNNVTFMNNSNPVAAHENCAAKYCHYFVNGNLHKCFLTGIKDELTDQFKIDNAAAKLLTSYNSCSPFQLEKEIEAFTCNLTEYIPQCSLCPEKRTSSPIWPLAKVKVSYE